MPSSTSLPVRGTPPTTPCSLPPELLLKIFKFVYLLCRTRPADLDMTDSSEVSNARWIHADPLSPSFFPHSIASVCSFWRDVTDLEPTFWTRFVIVIGKSTTSDLQSYLQRTGDYPLDVCIISAPERNRPPPHERSQVEAFMQILAPHICRCRTIRICVTLLSSLPSLHRHFRGTAPHLRLLKLQCQTTDNEKLPTEHKGSGWDFSSPLLVKVHLDGINFREGCVDDYRWFRTMKDSLHKLTIACGLPSKDMNEHGPRGRISINDLATIGGLLPNLATLVLKDVEFSDTNTLQALPISCRTENLVLEGLAEESMRMATAARWFESLVIKRCDLSQRLYGDRLALYDVTSDLHQSLASWEGWELSIDSCPLFDDQVLLDLAGGWCRKFHTLRISNCGGVSVEGLKQFVEKRFLDGEALGYGVLECGPKSGECAGMQGGASEREENPLQCLTVFGGPQLSVEDQRWFQARISTFTWQLAPAGDLPSEYMDSDYEGSDFENSNCEDSDDSDWDDGVIAGRYW
ncbi:hypothetical protein BV22DRAFT_273044 [Leucogyrophana mollusca]|uniref:Uncharacterized protein n=1 Tax=Leucogyrophana mollusca TaxID=85980 RepID=A0ACB8BRM1_9AGAM|nr:hypothetical protein BV22DRAFT_273044 [Leucogyrophana mollusca]